MEIKIHGWESKGIAGVDMEIDLNKPGTKTPTKIAMLWLDSGGGKTTTHELIKASLTGQIHKLEAEYNRDDGKPSKYERKRNERNYKDTGSFILKVSFDEKYCVFTIDFDHKAKTVDMHTKSAAGHQDGYAPPTAALTYLQPKFVDLFILDGEHAKKAIKENSGMADVTLNTIYQLDRFDDINDSLDKYFQDEKLKSRGNLSDKAKITQIENRITALKARRTKLSTEMRLNSKKKLDLEAKKRLLKKEKEGINKDDQNKRDRLNKEVDNLKILNDEIDLIKKEIFDLLKKPHHLSKSITKSFIKFTENLRKLDLPGDSAKEFFQNLVKTPKCVCNEPMTDARKKIILINSNDYIGTAHSNFASSMKQDVRDFIINEKEDSQDRLAECHAKLSEKNEELLKQKRLIEGLSKNVKTATGRSFEEIDNDIAECDRIIGQIDQFIDNYNAPDSTANESTRPKDVNSYSVIQALIKQAEAKRNLGHEMHNKQLKIEEMKEFIEEIKNEAKEKYKEELIVAMNSELDRIIEDDKVVITSIGSDIDYDGGSTGQGLVIAYVFLIKAFEQANKANKFPLLVDSPAAPIGPTYREAVALMITKLSNQYVCLLQGGEREWWCETLYENSKPDISVFTIFKETKRYQKYFDNPHEKLKKFDNSGIVKGYDFLAKFDTKTKKEAKDV